MATYRNKTASRAVTYRPLARRRRLARDCVPGGERNQRTTTLSAASALKGSLKTLRRSRAWIGSLLEDIIAVRSNARTSSSRTTRSTCIVRSRSAEMRIAPRGCHRPSVHNVDNVFCKHELRD
jgi:hypothetical protein